MSYIVLKEDQGNCCGGCCGGGCCSAIVGLMWLGFCVVAFMWFVSAIIR